MMMLIPLLLPLLQTPDAEIPSEPSSAYFRAVRLLEVEENGRAAAQHFIQLTEREAVQQNLDLYGRCLAQAYRCLQWTGAFDQAQVYADRVAQLPLSKMQRQQVRDIMQMGDATRLQDGEIDPKFLALVEEQLAQSEFRQLMRYGRRIMPYLIHLLESRRLFDKGMTVDQFSRIIAIGAALATDDFIMKLETAIAGQSSSLVGEVFDWFYEVGPQDETAWNAIDKFYVNRCKENDVSRARVGFTEAVFRIQRRRSEIIENVLLRELSNAESLYAPYVVDYMSPHPDSLNYQDLWIPAANSQAEGLADVFRDRLLKVRNADVLAQIAQQGHSQDLVRFLLAIFPSHHDEDPTKTVYEQGLDFVELKANELSPFLRVVDIDPHQKLINQSLRHDEAIVRHLAGSVAGAWGTVENQTNAVRSRDPLVQELVLNSAFRSPVWYGELRQDALKIARGRGKLAQLAGLVLAKSLRQLNLDELLIVEKAIAKKRPSDYFTQLKHLSHNAEGRQVLQSIMEHPEFPNKHKAVAVSALLESVEPLLATNGLHLIRYCEGARDRENAMGAVNSLWMDSVYAEGQRSGFLSNEQLSAILELCRLNSEHQVNHRKDAFFHILASVLQSGLPTTLELMDSILSLDREIVVFMMDGFRNSRPIRRASASILEGEWRVELFLRYMRSTSPADAERFAGWAFRVRSSGNRLADASYLAVRELLDTGRPALVDLALDILQDQPTKTKQDVDTIFPFLKEPRTASRAAYYLSTLPKAEDYVPRMMAVWTEVPQFEDRVLYVRALGQTLDDRVVPVLLEALASREKLISSEAGKALSNMKNIREQQRFWANWALTGTAESPIAALLPKLRSENREVKIAAIRSLGTLGSKESLPMLVGLLESKDAEILAAAREALEKINGSSSQD